jgi:signal peptidase II
MKSWAKVVVMIAVVACTIGCDRVSKRFASRELAGSPRQSYLGDTLRVEYAENRGGFLGLGSGLPDRVRTWLFTVGTAGVLVVLSLGMLRWASSARVTLGLSLLWAGGLSNLLDRVAHGRVVDFLNVGVGPLRTGIFNVADMAIMLGVALVLLGGWGSKAARDGRV